jgi:transposase
VRIIGIDEIYIGNNYKTIVRDLQSGAVLYVGSGKGGDALKGFEKRLRSAKCKIEVVAMDMSSGYSAWVKRIVRGADIVFDHFHVIKLMNERLDKIRRRTMSKLDDDTRKLLKNQRFTLLKNEENLNDDDRISLKKIKDTCDDLATGHALKEQLRSIYGNARDEYAARQLLDDWIKVARDSSVPELVSIAKTVESHRDGILAHWKHGHVTNAGMEGFNNKVRWLVRQAYGYRDMEYFVLKIYDLPACNTVKQL